MEEVTQKLEDGESRKENKNAPQKPIDYPFQPMDIIDIGKQISSASLDSKDLMNKISPTEQAFLPADFAVHPYQAEDGNRRFEIWKEHMELEDVGSDQFQWTEERDREIDIALESLSEIPIPRVYSQIEKIRLAIEADSIPAEEATLLLDEVDHYLCKQIKLKTSLPRIDHEDFMNARTLVLEALYALSESSALLKSYIASPHETHLQVSRALSEHAIQKLMEALEIMLELEPHSDYTL